MPDLQEKHQRWLCQKCKTLLGVTDKLQLEIKIRKAFYWIEGQSKITAQCRKCGEITVQYLL